MITMLYIMGGLLGTFGVLWLFFKVREGLGYPDM